MSKILIVTANLKDWTKNSGGKERTATLAEALVDHEVTVLSFSINGESYEKSINDYIYEIKPEVEPNIARKYKVLIQDVAKVNHDAAIFMLRRHFKRYKNRLKELSKDVDLVILDHPSAAALIEDLEDVPIVFNSHNCEITMAKQLYPENKDMLEIVEKMEGIALSKAIGTSYCSEKDFKEIKEHYSYSKNDIYIPNGTTMQKQSDPDVRTNSKTILFVGSGHKPNSLAALNLIPIANIFPEYDFVVCGGSSFSLNKSKQISTTSIFHHHKQMFT